MIIASILFKFRHGPALCLVTGLLTINAAPALAQNLTAPADRVVPAFSIVDSSLMSIEHIDPLFATSITLFSTLRKDDLLPRDIAVELLPWLPTSKTEARPVPELFATLDKLTFRQTFTRYAAFSLAISQDVTRVELDDAVSQIAVAARTFVAGGKLNSRMSELMRDYLSASDQLDKLEAALSARAPSGAPDARDEELAMLLIRSRDLIRRIAAAPKNRVGLLVEAGGGVVFQTPDNSLSQAERARMTAWLTPMYRSDRRPVDFSGIVRVNVDEEPSGHTADIGARIGASRGGIYYSLEGLARKRFTDVPIAEDDLKYGRLVGGIAYGFNKGTHMQFTFGKNYSRGLSGGGSITASFGLTIGLGQIPIGEMPEGQ